MRLYCHTNKFGTSCFIDMIDKIYKTVNNNKYLITSIIIIAAIIINSFKTRNHPSTATIAGSVNELQTRLSDFELVSYKMFPFRQS